MLLSEVRGSKTRILFSVETTNLLRVLGTEEKQKLWVSKERKYDEVFQKNKTKNLIGLKIN